MPAFAKSFTNSRRRNGIFRRKKNGLRLVKASKPKSVKTNRHLHKKNKSPTKKVSEANYLGWYMCARQSAIWDPKEFAVLDWTSSDDQEHPLEETTPEFTCMNDMKVDEPQQNFKDYSGKSLLSCHADDDSDTSSELSFDPRVEPKPELPRTSSLGKRSKADFFELPRTESISKRHKAIHEVSEEKAQPIEVEIPVDFQQGDRVRILKGAKKQFIGKLAKVEKYLISKDKWGLLIGKNKRIALGTNCLEKAVRKVMFSEPEETKTVASSKVVQEIVHTLGQTLVENTPIAKDTCVEKYDDMCTTGYVRRVHFKNKNKVPFSMVAAIREERLDIIKNLVLSNKCDINCQNGLKQNALHIACQYQKTKCAMLLIEMGIQINHIDNEKHSPLMIAAREGLADLVKALVHSRAIIDLQDPDGMTALMFACANGHHNVVKTLLANQASTDLENDVAQNAMMVALAHGHHHIAEQIMNLSINEEMHKNDVEDQKPLVHALDEALPVLVRKQKRAEGNSL